MKLGNVFALLLAMGGMLYLLYRYGIVPMVVSFIIFMVGYSIGGSIENGQERNY